MSQWQLIETAPKDGTEVLLYSHYLRQMFIGGYVRRGAWKLFGHRDLYETEPTHWMPLPAPPEVTP
jgi:hypothetical protein